MSRARLEADLLRFGDGSAEPDGSLESLYIVRHHRGFAAAVSAALLFGCTARHTGPATLPHAQASLSTQVSRGHVAGRLLGIAMPGVFALPGTVTLRGPTTYTVRVRSDGAFSVAVVPGTYLLTGRSPSYGSRGVCRHDGPLSVAARGYVQANVVCEK